MSTATIGKARLGAKGRKPPKRNKPRRQSVDNRLRSGCEGSGAGLRVLRNLLLAIATLSAMGLLCVALLFGYRWLTSVSYFGLQEITVSGNDRLSYGDVLATAGVELGQNCLDVNVSTVENKLSSSPWIASATVRRELPGQLRIAVTEREPSFWVHRGERIYYADETGRIIAPVSQRGFASMPLLEVDDHTPHTEVAAMLHDVVTMINDKSLPFALGQTASIRLTESGDVHIFLDSHDLRITFSRDGWRTQLGRIMQVWRDLRRRGEFEQAIGITAREDRVWVEKRAARS